MTAICLPGFLYFMAKPYDFSKEVGRRFGDLTFMGFSHRIAYHPYVWCLCDCGIGSLVCWDNLKSGRTKSCGCKKGCQTKYTKHPLYTTWSDMNQRCTNSKRDNFPRYGGNGVRVAEEWRHDFPAFLKWSENNGWRPGLQLDKDIKAKEMGMAALLYSPDRCSWVTPMKNARTKRNVKLTEEQADEIRKSDKTAIELSQIYGIHKNGIWAIKRGQIWV